MDDEVKSNGNVSDSNDSKDGTPGIRKSKRIFKEVVCFSSAPQFDRNPRVSLDKKTHWCPIKMCESSCFDVDV